MLKQQKKNLSIKFTWLSKKKKEKNRERRQITAVRREIDIKFTVMPINAVLETPSL